MLTFRDIMGLNPLVRTALKSTDYIYRTVNYERGYLYL